MMRTRMVRYRVRADRAEENVRYVENVFAALERESPPGVRYAVFRLDDGVSFVHLVSLEGPDDTNALRALPEFDAFLAGIRDRCEEAPVTVALQEVGSYRVFSTSTPPGT
ncbi:MAG: hypothetical protein JWL95_2241 [Gemmatimonadetes bacterium]|nr:hypothetical protein [Gemmatimonadota bacterium]